jgi:cytochrome d ubiquinol oxidase subunit II
MSIFQDLPSLWFALIAILWIGYLIFEGAGFGVGVLTPFLARDDIERRMLISTVKPLRFGNELWFLLAAGATWAAFPRLGVTLFRSFLPVVLLVLATLVFRALALEYARRPGPRRVRLGPDQAIFLSGLAPALLSGLFIANLVSGVQMDSRYQLTGSWLHLLRGYAWLGGFTTLALFTLHGALFLSLRTEGPIRIAARRMAARIWWPAMVSLAVFLIWSFAVVAPHHHQLLAPGSAPQAALVAMLVVGWLRHERWERAAFAASGLTMALLFAALAFELYPRVLISSSNPAWSLTTALVPLVVVYHGWSYWTCRRRIRRSDLDVA